MKLVFLLYEKMTALDLVGPHEILSRLPQAETLRVALEKGPVLSDSGLVLYADAALSDVNQADILVVPGAGNATSLKSHPMILNWIKQIHQTTEWTTSVCTGSLILGAAGILDGVSATTHWAAFERLNSCGAKPVHARVVEDGKVMTAAGVSAGIDMALVLASKVIGPEFAQTMQLALEYDPNPPFDTGSPNKAPKDMSKNLKTRMVSFFEEEL
jgi:transcriptional regulator GlxA family with amidase domain